MQPYGFSWETLDTVVSVVAALSNAPMPSYALARPKGSKNYAVQVQMNGEVHSLHDLLERYPSVLKRIKDGGFGMFQEDVNIFVAELMQQDQWSARYCHKNTWTQSAWRRMTPHLFHKDMQLTRDYWSEVLSGKDVGQDADKWAVRLQRLLSSPYSVTAKAEAIEYLKKISLRRIGWEQQAGQSLRVWAGNSTHWHKLLDKWDISHKHTHEGVAGVVWAIQNGWGHFWKGWKNETKMDLTFVPKFEELPTSWTDNQVANGSLWHWTCVHAPLSFVRDNAPQDNRLANALGETPLHWVCSHGREDVARFLVTSTCVDLGMENQDQKLAAELIPEQMEEFFNWMEDQRAVGSAPCLG